jgi:site-specific DNA-methyltransferase (adenine-specific)
MNINQYLLQKSIPPLFLCGNCLEILEKFPDNSIDMVITSPPYWGKREYSNGGIGLEKAPNDFVNNLLQIIFEIMRVLKSEGSFWLNIGDTYKNKSLAGIPWRIAIKMVDEQGWILRNEVIWNKVKGGMDNAKDKLGNIHEPLFHFVKSYKYFYDVDAIRSKPKKATIKNGTVISATGVSGIRYKRQLELSTTLTDLEKKNAYHALENILNEVRSGLIYDFRMVIRGQQRVTHSNSTNVSGRAKEIEEKGYYFLKYHPNGSKPRDVWDIIPEDTQNRKSHFAPFPEDLCKIPILSTCPQNGIVLDPFAGTGTSNAVAYSFGRKSIGIDISEEYINIANRRFSEPILLEAVNV